MLNPPGTLPAELVCNFEKEAKVIVDKALRRATQLGPCVSCDAKILEGQPADVLLKQSHNATLVVVGSRGRGEFASLLFGSVSQEVTRHAKCPVVVVPASSG
jgi:nucleotide-binding universal stress UspA family protein